MPWSRYFSTGAEDGEGIWCVAIIGNNWDEKIWISPYHGEGGSGSNPVHNGSKKTSCFLSNWYYRIGLAWLLNKDLISDPTIGYCHIYNPATLSWPASTVTLFVNCVSTLNVLELTFERVWQLLVLLCITKQLLKEREKTFCPHV